MAPVAEDAAPASAAALPQPTGSSPSAANSDSSNGGRSRRTSKESAEPSESGGGGARRSRRASRDFLFENCGNVFEGGTSHQFVAFSKLPDAATASGGGDGLVGSHLSYGKATAASVEGVVGNSSHLYAGELSVRAAAEGRDSCNKVPDVAAASESHLYSGELPMRAAAERQDLHNKVPDVALAGESHLYFGELPIRATPDEQEIYKLPRAGIVDHAAGDSHLFYGELPIRAADGTEGRDANKDVDERDELTGTLGALSVVDCAPPVPIPARPTHNRLPVGPYWRTAAPHKPRAVEESMPGLVIGPATPVEMHRWPFAQEPE